jgi:hypothetical protein
MRDSINTWGDYRTLVREFDAVLEHGKAVSAMATVAASTAPHASYGRQIYVKLLAHCAALRRLAPDPQQALPRDPWDLSSMSALARCAIEAFDAFEYVAGHPVPEEERSFRIRLWELHDATRRLRIVTAVEAGAPVLETIRGDMARLRAGLETHPHLSTLSAELRAELLRRFAREDAPAFHLNQRQRCTLSGIDADWHHLITLQLSQHVHTLPFSVHELSALSAGTPDMLGLLSQPLAFALPFLARAVHGVTPLMANRPPEPPSRTARTMHAWRTIGQQPSAT